MVVRFGMRTYAVAAVAACLLMGSDSKKSSGSRTGHDHAYGVFGGGSTSGGSSSKTTMYSLTLRYLGTSDGGYTNHQNSGKFGFDALDSWPAHIAVDTSITGTEWGNIAVGASFTIINGGFKFPADSVIYVLDQAGYGAGVVSTVCFHTSCSAGGINVGDQLGPFLVTAFSTNRCPEDTAQACDHTDSSLDSTCVAAPTPDGQGGRWATNTVPPVDPTLTPGATKDQDSVPPPSLAPETMAPTYATTVTPTMAPRIDHPPTPEPTTSEPTTSEPTTSEPTTSEPTPAPTTSDPTPQPTPQPTRHACEDGSHGCDATEFGICEQVCAGSDCSDYQCSCAGTHFCSDGDCSSPDHTCVTSPPTPAPTTSEPTTPEPTTSEPTPAPTLPPTEPPTTPAPTNVVGQPETDFTTGFPVTTGFGTGGPGTPRSQDPAAVCRIDFHTSDSLGADDECPATRPVESLFLNSSVGFTTQVCTEHESGVSGVPTTLFMTIQPVCKVRESDPQRWTICSWQPDPDSLLCTATGNQCCNYIVDYITVPDVNDLNIACQEYVEGQCNQYFGFHEASNSAQRYGVELIECVGAVPANPQCAQNLQAQAGWVSAEKEGVLLVTVGVGMVALAAAIAIRRRRLEGDVGTYGGVSGNPKTWVEEADPTEPLMLPDSPERSAFSRGGTFDEPLFPREPTSPLL